MSELLKRTDEEIIEWLKENHAEYADMTDAMRQDMVNNWQAMLDDMHGAITTYWEEVEAIIAQGDDAIIDFLMEHCADYKEAGRLQAEAYVDQWKKKLEDLRNAYKAVADEIASFNYTPVPPSTGGGSSGGGGSGGGSATSYTYGYMNAKGGWVKTASSTSQQKAFDNALAAAKTHWKQYTGQYGVSEVFRYLRVYSTSHDF